MEASAAIIEVFSSLPGILIEGGANFVWEANARRLRFGRGSLGGQVRRGCADFQTLLMGYSQGATCCPHFAEHFRIELVHYELLPFFRCGPWNHHQRSMAHRPD